MSETKLCRACGKIKPVSQFYSSTGQTPDGLRPRCKNCQLQKKQIPSELKKPKKTSEPFSFDDKNDYKIIAPKKNDYMLMYELLKIMGYSPDNAHEDFCKKWGLKPKYKAVRCQPVYLSNGEKNPLFRQTWFSDK